MDNRDSKSQTSPDGWHLSAERRYPVGPGGDPGNVPWAFGIAAEAKSRRSGALQLPSGTEDGWRCEGAFGCRFGCEDVDGFGFGLRR